MTHGRVHLSLPMSFRPAAVPAGPAALASLRENKIKCSFAKGLSARGWYYRAELQHVVLTLFCSKELSLNFDAADSFIPSLFSWLYIYIYIFQH